ncbi:hedgehog-interacting -like protein [Labeo rohita]|uniref:Hedgehog-interacting-like protein n=1 Tax=Labeo rohita TaxID=84645 RepID=A0A498N1L5_LABRO|nr:hedgehog-interacting -like protein [Labeo rohita]
MKHLKFVLLLAIAANFWECGDAKFGEKGELSPRRRRCYDGSLPKRLKKKERKLSLEGSGGGEVCHRLYPRVSCCPSRRAPYQILHRKDARIFSTNNTECSRLLEEIKCAHCSPHAQMLFHSPKVEKAPHREQDLPRLCHDYCQEFYYTCRGHVPELFQADVDEFCQYYGRKDGGLCFPDFHRKQLRRDSNYLLDEKIEVINRKHKHNCYCTQEILSGLRQPIGVVHCGDGSQRLFILEKEGFVRVLTHDMELLKEPFLDIHKLVQSGIKGGDERGLLSLAFHPNYKKNGKLYVSYTTNQERWAIGPHDHILRVVEYTVSRKNPNQVDTRTTRVLMEVAELHRKHLGGQLLFGPDGLLHIFLGDGMITLDDMEEMDGLSDFTGSVLRVDVDTDCCSTPYSIPKNNPYFNSTNQPPEIFAHGLHDPGRCAVDKLRMDTNGSLLILCTDTVGKNTTTGRILQVIKGKDYGEVYILASSKSTAIQSHNGKLYKLVDPKSHFYDRSRKSFSPSQVHMKGISSIRNEHIATQSPIFDVLLPQVPKECRRPVEDPEMLSTACSRECKNGHCTPTGKCCCSSGWEGPFCLRAKCEPACRNGGVCVEPNKCLCKEGFSGSQCEKGERGTRGDGEKDSILEHIIDMTSYLLDLTSYIV